MGGIKRQVVVDVPRSGGLQLASWLPAGHLTRGFRSHMHDVRRVLWLAIWRELCQFRSIIAVLQPAHFGYKKGRMEHHDQSRFSSA